MRMPSESVPEPHHLFASLRVEDFCTSVLLITADTSQVCRCSMQSLETQDFQAFNPAMQSCLVPQTTQLLRW